MDFLEAYWWVWAMVFVTTALYVMRRMSADLRTLSHISYANDSRTERELALLALRPNAYRSAIESAVIMAAHVSGGLLALAIVAHLTGGT